MNLPKFGAALVIPLVLSGCLYGQCMDGACALERAEYLKSIKAYGEYWVKPSMTKESWRQDWVTCGGMPNGSYANNAPQGSSTATIRVASERISKKLGDCMQEKGYTYHSTGP